jgi:hypothetical protein
VFIETLKFVVNEMVTERNENTKIPFHRAVTGCRMMHNKGNREKWE